MKRLGILEEIKDPRTVWPHEALDFTPWLSQDDNISLLAKIGFFLCEIKLYKIGESEPAVKFEWLVDVMLKMKAGFKKYL